jgi:nitroreductase
VPNELETQNRLLAARYGTDFDLTSTPVAWNETLDLLVCHRTVRKYLVQPVDDALINAVAVAAQSAASASNLQTWSVVEVRDPATIREISAVCTQPHVAVAPAVLIWVADFSRVQAIAETTGENAESIQYVDTLLSLVLDVGIAAQNAVVAAESLGLGTVYLGSVRNNAQRISELLELPHLTIPMVGLSVGWPDPSEDADIKPRLPLKTVLHHEKYDKGAFGPALEEYEPISAEYYRRYNLGESWTERVHERAVDGRSERNKAYMTQWLKDQGFGLT